MNSATAAMRLGPSIKQARTQQGFSLRRLAERTGVPRTTIERIEQEKLELPRPDILHALGEALGLAVPDLYSLANYPTVTALPSFAPYLRPLPGPVGTGNHRTRRLLPHPRGA